MSPEAHVIQKKMTEKPRKPGVPLITHVPTKEEVVDAKITTNMIDFSRNFEEAVVATSSVVGKTAESWNRLNKAFFPIYSSFIDAVSKPWEDLGKAADVFREKKDIGITPKEEVAKHGLARLYHYKTPEHYDPSISKDVLEKRKQKPLMLVFARMNRPEIMDLAPGKSYAEHMTKQGYSVYLMDWGKFKKGEPGWKENKNIDFEDDVLEILPHMVDEMKKHSGAKKFALQGWCQGSLVTSMYAAVQPEIQPDAGLDKLVCLTPPFNHSGNDGALTKMVYDHHDELKAIVKANDGIMPGDVIDTAVKIRNPEALLFGPYKIAYDAVKKNDNKTLENMKDMQNWMQNLTDIPGPWYLRFIDEMYMKNNFVNGGIVLTSPQTGEKYIANSKKVKVPTLVIGAERDDIAPRDQWIDSAIYFGGQTEVREIKGAGHISLMASGRAKETWGIISKFIDRGESATSLPQKMIYQSKPQVKQAA